MIHRRPAMPTKERFKNMTLGDRLLNLGSPEEIFSSNKQGCRVRVIESGEMWCEMEYQPGNMTLYHLTLLELDEKIIVSWIWRAGGMGGECVTVFKGASADVNYYASKMKVNVADMTPILELLKEMGYIERIIG